MAKLSKIYINTTSDGERDRHELRLDWDDDTHQAIYLESLSAIDVESAMAKAIQQMEIARLTQKNNKTYAFYFSAEQQQQIQVLGDSFVKTTFCGKEYTEMRDLKYGIPEWEDSILLGFGTYADTKIIK